MSPVQARSECIRRVQRRRVGALVASGLLAVLLAATSGAAAPPQVAIVARYELAGAGAGSSSGPSMVGVDGTVWAAEGGDSGGSFAIVARAAGARRLGPVKVPADGSEVDVPVIAAAGGSATFVWESAAVGSGITSVIARRCTLAGCAPAHTLGKWVGAPLFSGGIGELAAVPEPAVASVGQTTLVVFYRDSQAGPTMEWTQSSGGRFGPLHSFGVTGSPEPILVSESGGRALTAWLNTTESGAVVHGTVSVEWSLWSASGGFTRLQRVSAGRAHYGGSLVGAAVGSGAALAWIQSPGSSGAGLASQFVWSAREQTRVVGKAAVVSAGPASGLAIAGGDGDVAVIFSGNSDLEPVFPTNGSPVWEATSLAGARFGAPVELDDDAAPAPGVSIAANGAVLASWNSLPSSDAKLAMAPADGVFETPLTLGEETDTESPAIHADGARSLVVWQDAASSQLLAAVAAP